MPAEFSRIISRSARKLHHGPGVRLVVIENAQGRIGTVDDLGPGNIRILPGGVEAHLLSGKLLKGGAYPSFGDHRMVMALKVASLGADSPVTIDDTACVAKSFPTFNDLFDKL